MRNSCVNVGSETVLETFKVLTIVLWHPRLSVSQNQRPNLLAVMARDGEHH